MGSASVLSFNNSDFKEDGGINDIEHLHKNEIDSKIKDFKESKGNPGFCESQKKQFFQE
jgi:hypothetical protein